MVYVCVQKCVGMLLCTCAHVSAAIARVLGGLNTFNVFVLAAFQ